jgi:hypothetical protein
LTERIKSHLNGQILNGKNGLVGYQRDNCYSVAALLFCHEEGIIRFDFLILLVSLFAVASFNKFISLGLGQSVLEYFSCNLRNHQLSVFYVFINPILLMNFNFST